jgi:hypothetical protein
VSPAAAKIKYSEETELFNIILHARTKMNEANLLRFDKVVAQINIPRISKIV